MKKECSVCKEIKEECEFRKWRNQCKCCVAVYQKKYDKGYREKNKNKIKKANKKYYVENKDTIKESNHNWYVNNKKKLNQKSKRYYNENKDRARNYSIKYNEENREKINERKKIRKKTDPLFRLNRAIRGNIQQSLHRKGYKKSSKTYDMLGCNYKELLIHLNNNPYNFKYEDGLCDIDHIIPTSSANTETGVIKLSHYTNLQLLPSDYNRHIKRDKEADYNRLEQWLEETNFYQKV